MEKRIILASDTHLCKAAFYGSTPEKRTQKFIDDLRAEYDKQPFEALLLLGDYSLDHWIMKGSYLEKGVSYTKIFVENYLSQLSDLPIEIRMIAGNHEQYGEELFQTLTGYRREDVYVTEDWLFILLDTYGGNLDPTEHHDGGYTGANVAFIREQMAMHPNKKVILCSHYFIKERETEEFRKLLCDPSVICLFAGHTHLSNIWHMEEEFGSKKVLFTGHYGNSGENPPTKCMWGFRELILREDCIQSSYITPENTITVSGEQIVHPYGKQDSIQIPL